MAFACGAANLGGSRPFKAARLGSPQHQCFAVYFRRSVPGPTAHTRPMKLRFVARASRRAASTVVSTFFSALTATRLQVQREINALPLFSTERSAPEFSHRACTGNRNSPKLTILCEKSFDRRNRLSHRAVTACFVVVGQAVPPANHRSPRLFTQTLTRGAEWPLTVRVKTIHALTALLRKRVLPPRSLNAHAVW